MKDEFKGEPISSFIGTGAKAYCVNLKQGIEKRAKGVKKYVTKNSLTRQDYTDVIENNEIKYREMSIFKSILHDMFTQLKNKIALSPKDDKRYIIPGNFRTLAWGHRDIEILESRHDSGNQNSHDSINILKDVDVIDDMYKL